MGSDEYLAVAGAYQGSQYAVYRFQGCLVELGLVLQGETKSRCAVDTVVDVVSPADSGDDGLNQFLVCLSPFYFYHIQIFKAFTKPSKFAFMMLDGRMQSPMAMVSRQMP